MTTSDKGPLADLRYARDLIDDAIKGGERLCELGGRLDAIRGLDHLVKAAENVGEAVETALAHEEGKRVAEIEQEEPQS